MIAAIEAQFALLQEPVKVLLWVLPRLERICSTYFEEGLIDVVLSVVESPFAFLKMKQEHILPHSAQFCKAELRIAPKALNAIDVVLSSGEFVLVMVDAVVFVTVAHQAVIRSPAVGVDRAFTEHFPLDDRQQFLARAVGNDFHINALTAFEQSDDRCFPTRTAPAFSTHAAWSEVALVDLDLAGERLRFLTADLKQPQSEQGVDTLCRITIQRAEFGCAKC